MLRALWRARTSSARPTRVAPPGRHEHEAVRAWAIRLLTDALPLDTILSQRGGPDGELPTGPARLFVRHAREDRSGLVRLVLASTLQRLPVASGPSWRRRWSRAAEDAADHDIPLLLWTA